MAGAPTAFERAAQGHRPESALVLGEVGLGKSRLARELVDRLKGRAHVLEGHCPSYGEGALYPVEQAIKELAGIRADEAPEPAREKLAALLGDGEPAVHIQLAATLRLSDRSIEMQDSFWAIRRLLESLAERRPVLFIVDDLHWAQDQLLELLDYLGGAARCPALLVSLSRPELLEREPGAASVSAEATIRLAPISSDESEAVITQMLGDARLPGEALARIEERAAGNPLFLEELVRALVERGHLRREHGAWHAAQISELPIPDTVDALLQARIEALPSPERETLEAAAIADESVWAGAIAALVSTHTEQELDAELARLVERGFLAPITSVLAGEKQLRFAHVLIRETAYRGIAKRRRAESHLRLADWVENRTAAGSGDFDEAIGRHLQASHRYRSEFGAPQEELAELARRAVARLLRAGRGGARAR